MNFELKQLSIAIDDGQPPADGPPRNPKIYFTDRRRASRRREVPSEFERQTMLEKVIKQKLVMVGNGMAGVRTLEELLKLAPDLYDITVFGAEPHPQLQPHPAVAGARRRADPRRHRAQHRATGTTSNDITLHPGKKVATIDRARREVRRRRRQRGALRPPAARHRLQPVHPAGAGQGPARRDHLPRHRTTRTR